MIKKQNIFTVFKDAFNYERRDKFETFNLKDIKGFPEYAYIEKDSFVNMNNFRFGYTNGILIVIEENMPEYLKEFVLYHEIAHMKFHKVHLEDKKEMKKINRLRRHGKVHKMEYEADSFATERVGYYNAIQALSYMYGILKQSELLDRIEYIKNKYKDQYNFYL